MENLGILGILGFAIGGYLLDEYHISSTFN
jgi:hypothetical protein